ncbi:MAG: methyltransferase domain-containing protein [Candidatus Uhrbacteria bacterium]|nr:methyltransferase domain-containing protein [Candidatus Uhrbacteria bacterium]
MKNQHQEYISQQEKIWLDEFAKFVTRADTLKIGNGLGHLSELIRPLTKSLTIIDTAIFPQAVNKEAVLMYSGFPIPFADKSFETSIIVFTLHHIPSNREYFKEILRVTSKRIILIEETYDAIFQKLHIFWRDWIVNRSAEQPCRLYWNSYFSRKKLDTLIKDSGLKEIYRKTKKHKTYFKELVILEL